MTKLREKVIWITGASSGIGAALAVELAARGARLILSARRVERLETLAERCAGAAAVEVVPFDLAERGRWDAAIEQARAVFGRIDVLVHNAGVSQRARFDQLAPEVIDKLYLVDLIAPVQLTHRVLPAMVERGGGHLVFVSSLVGLVATPQRTIYSSAKHGMNGFADALRAEVAEHGVTVTLALPGFVRTEVSLNALEGDGTLHGKMDPGQQRGITAERCARVLARAIERERREVRVGMGLLGTVAVLLKRVAPGLLARILRKAKVT